MGGMGTLGKYTVGAMASAVEDKKAQNEFERALERVKAMDFATPVLNDFKEQLIEAMGNESYMPSEDGSASVASLLSEMNEIVASTNNAQDKFVLALADNAVRQGAYRYGQMQAIKSYVEDKIGEYENADGNVYEVADTQGNIYYMLDSTDDAVIVIDRNTGEKSVKRKDYFNEGSIKQTNGSDFALQTFMLNIDRWNAEQQQIANEQVGENHGNAEATYVTIHGQNIPIERYDEATGMYYVLDAEGNEVKINPADEGIELVFEGVPELIDNQNNNNVPEVAETAEQNGVDNTDTDADEQNQAEQAEQIGQQEEIEYDNEGNPVWLSASVERGKQEIDSAFEGDEAKAFVKDKVKEAKKAVKKLENKKPKATNIRDRKAEIEQIRVEKEQAMANLDYWNSMSQLYNDPIEEIVEPVVENENVVSPISEAINAKVAEWSNLGVKVNVANSVDNITNEKVAKDIKDGVPVAGWYDTSTGEVYVYAPNLTDTTEIDKTIIHEVVAHKGLRNLIGETEYQSFCERVFDMMPKELQDKYMAYPGVNGRKAAAADEYIAYLAEKEDLTAEEQALWDKLIQYFREMFDKALNGIVSKSDITNEDISKLIRMSYANIKNNAQQEADTTVESQSQNEEVADNGVVFENDTNGQAMYSIKTYREGGRDNLVNFAQKQVESNKLTQEQAEEIVSEMDSIYEMIQQYKDVYQPFGVWSEADVKVDDNGKAVFSVVKPNGEYDMNLDFSLVCKKRRTLDSVFDEMIKRGIISEFELGQVDVAKINEIIREFGFETACRLCFVDAKRFRVAQVADQFCAKYNELVVMNDKQLKQVIKTEEKNSVRKKIAKHLLDHPEDKVILSRDNFMSANGFENIKVNKAAVMSLYNQAKGTGGPKASFGDIQYLNEIADSSWTPEKAYAVGGVRLQSFSDYVPRMVFDYIQMVADLAAKKLPVHSYTKESTFAKQFGLTGIKINMSLVPRVDADGVAPGLDKDGNYTWQEGETFPFDEAIAIQNAEGYKDNCGTIAVGISDEHILKMLDDENIRMVIPYHKSGLNKEVAKFNNIDQFVDYTNSQNTRYADGKKLNKADSKKHFNFNEDLHKNNDPRGAAQRYLEWCDEKGYIPKFEQYRNHPNYYKLLEDFTTVVTENGVDTVVPQRAVEMKFPKDADAFGSLETLIQQGLEEDAVLEGRRSEKIGEIVDKIEETLPKNNPTDPNNGPRYRTSAEIDKEYPNWLEGTTNESGKHSTQVTKTVGTYNKVGEWIENNLGKDVEILDASSGMGLGTQSLREKGFNIEDVEPYQSEDRKQNNPATYSAYADIEKQYDYIISNAVLNVIPDDWRADVLHNMAARMKNGGKMFINTRKAGEEKSIKDKIELDTPQEVLVKRNGKIASYQKFFTPQELKSWVEQELGDGYTVEVANEKNSGTKGLAAVVVTKNSDIRYRSAQPSFTDEENAIIEKAKENGTYLKAPNGKDTNLTPKQWAQVRTNAFKEWFGDWENDPENASKVVDENGEPMVVYHGTNHDFYTFDESKNDLGDRGFYLTNNERMAKSYGKRLIKSFVNIRNPIEVIGEKSNWNGIRGFNPYDLEKMSSSELKDLYNEVRKKGVHLYDFYSAIDWMISLKESKEAAIPNKDSWNLFKRKDARDTIKIVDNHLKTAYKKANSSYLSTTREIVNKENDGKDGVIFKNIYDYGAGGNLWRTKDDTPGDVFIAYSPNQIKSATENVGTFSKENDDIRYRIPSTPAEARQRAENIMKDAIDPMARELGVEVNYVTSEDISDVEPGARKKRQSKGWYQDGKVYINLSTHETIDDAKETYLHEVVAHYGLRGLLKEQFEPVMQKVFASLTPTQQQSLLEIFADEVEAAEEFLASMAENDIDPTLVEKVIGFIREALRSMGINLDSYTDGDMQYLLWRSKNSLKENAGNVETARWEAKDADVRYRTVGRPANYLTNDLEMTAKDKFLHKIQDRMRPVTRLIREIEQRGGRINEASDVHSQEFLSASRASAEMEDFNFNKLTPFVDSFAQAMKVFAEKMGMVREDAQQAVYDYLYARHAPERNKRICMDEMLDAAKKGIAPDKVKLMDADFIAELGKVAEQLYDNQFNGGTNLINPSPALSPEQNKLLIILAGKMQKEADKISRHFETDASGKSVYIGNNRSGMNDVEAKQLLNKLYTPQTSGALDDVSAKVKVCTDFTLDKWLEYGLISQAEYNEYKARYNNYIPLRGWEEKGDNTDYASILNSHKNSGGLLDLNRQAKGRWSKADNPIAHIQSMAQSACITGNRNLIRRKAFNLVMQNEGIMSDLATFEYTYEVYDDNGNLDYTTPIKPEQSLFDEGKVKTIRDKSYEWHKTSAEIDTHVVSVFINGDRHNFVFKGTLGGQVATAVKGNENKTTGIIKQLLAKGTRAISANLTARNVYFLSKNLMRDLGFGNFAYFVENGKFINPAVYAGAMKTAAMDAMHAEPSSIKDYDLYQEFKLNGGQTGYVQLKDIDNLKKDFDKLLKDATANDGFVVRNGKEMWDTLTMTFDVMGKASENAMRFAVYKMERQRGASPREAAIRAKEITVNFNRQGVDTKGWSAAYAFFNPAVQGAYRYAKLLKKHPGRFVIATAALMAMKFGLGVICEMFSGGDDEPDGESAYDRLSDYVKATNWVIPLSWMPGEGNEDKFLCIPLPQSVRASTHLSDCAVDILFGRKDFGEALKDAALFAAGEFLPFDIDAIDVEGKRFIPSLVQSAMPTIARPLYEAYVSNRDFMGNPISKEPFLRDQDYIPQSELAFGSTSPILVGTSKFLNKLAGGDDYRSAGLQITQNGQVVESALGNFMDVNPARLEHLFSGYFGGVFKPVVDTWTTMSSFVDEDVELTAQSAVLVNQFIKGPTSKPGYKTYYRMRDENDDIVNAVNIYKDKPEYSEDYKRLISNRYNHEVVEYYKTYSEIVKNLNESIALIKTNSASVEDHKEKIAELEAQRDALILEAATVYRDICKRRDNDN